jgi:hypothetical protein
MNNKFLIINKKCQYASDYENSDPTAPILRYELFFICACKEIQQSHCLFLPLINTSLIPDIGKILFSFRNIMFKESFVIIILTIESITNNSDAVGVSKGTHV